MCCDGYSTEKQTEVNNCDLTPRAQLVHWIETQANVEVHITKIACTICNFLIELSPALF